MTEYELSSYHKNLLHIGIAYNSFIQTYFPIVDLFENGTNYVILKERHMLRQHETKNSHVAYF